MCDHTGLFISFWPFNLLNIVPKLPESLISILDKLVGIIPLEPLELLDDPGFQVPDRLGWVSVRSAKGFGNRLINDPKFEIVPGRQPQRIRRGGICPLIGLLPQDRRHSVKLSASYMTGFGLAVGTRFLWQTGTPLSIRGGSPIGGLMFLAERGSMGQTPNIWDLDLRFVYDFQHLIRRSSPVRIVLDLFNIGSPREAVAYDQICCFTMTEDGNQTDPNPNYLQPTRYQPPMMVRLGLEVGF